MEFRTSEIKSVRNYNFNLMMKTISIAIYVFLIVVTSRVMNNHRTKIRCSVSKRSLAGSYRAVRWLRLLVSLLGVVLGPPYIGGILCPKNWIKRSKLGKLELDRFPGSK